MDLIEQYFQGDYIVEKNRIREVEELLSEAFTSFTVYNANGWHYELDGQKKRSELLPSKISMSTNSMILCVLSKLLDYIDKQPHNVPEISWSLDEIKEKNRNQLLKKLTDIFKLVKTNLIKDLKGHSRILVDSSTFGHNDPFTLSWLSDLILFDSEFNEIREKFIKISIDKIYNTFKNPHLPILKFKRGSGRIPSNHIFPLLGIIHLYENLADPLDTKSIKSYFLEGFEKEEDKNKYEKKFKEIKGFIISKLYTNLSDRINEQISYSVTQYELFDTAELVLSLEGLILIDKDKKVEEKLLTKAFEILKKNQENNLYWRPLRPFVTSPQGDILLPLSIEIANSLLRICKHLESKGIFYYHDYYEIFDNYTKWLLSSVSQCDIENQVFKGWHSEHVQKTNVIHPWETAQVIIYLMNYKSMLQDYIAFKALKYSALSSDLQYFKQNSIISSSEWKKKWEATETLFDGGNIYRDIREDFIEKRIKNSTDKKYSMLLYGPPGTGKSSLAKDLAESLNWKLITITPGDFIRQGESDIERRAKNIFKTLEEQQECIILFDEIDRFILDRDSDTYSSQSDMFQFMTPSMLVKIKNLRSKKKCVFIIATNYEERIDSAIKRAGRIDERYLICSPDLEQRKKIISKIVEDNIKDLKTKDTDFGGFAKKSVLFTYDELERIIKLAIDKLGNITKDNHQRLFDELENTQFDEPTIKISSYKRRFQTVKEIENEKEKHVNLPVFPFKEFLSLIYLKLEADIKLNGIEDNLLKCVISLEGFKLSNFFDKELPIYKKLDVQINGNSQSNT